MSKKRSFEELVKDTFTKNLGQQIDERSDFERTVYYCIAGFVVALIVFVWVFFLF